jgi:hypothetical protein
MRVTQSFLQQQPRWVWFVLSGVVLLLLLSLLWAPNNDWQRSGSTYNRSPDGYAAWYEYMEKQGVPLQRSRQSIDDLLAGLKQAGDSQPKTLLQIQPRLTASSRWIRHHRSTAKFQLNDQTQTWLAAGNHLIVLGVSEPVRPVNFSSQVPSEFGPVTIETSRRASPIQGRSLLADRSGAIVWAVDPTSNGEPSAPSGQQRGNLIFATTPHLGANAYQSAPGNYAFLANLVAQQQAPLIINEYIHGYREPVASGAQSQNRQQSPSRNLVGYFAQTPLLPIGVQAVVLVLMTIWAKNQRFGRLRSVEPPSVDNSTAYIQALAGALRQANSRSFVMETVGQAELRQLQRQLGLGDQPMTIAELLAAWAPQQRSSDELKALLRLQSHKQLSDRELLIWLQYLQHLRQPIQ